MGSEERHTPQGKELVIGQEQPDQNGNIQLARSSYIGHILQMGKFEA